MFKNELLYENERWRLTKNNKRKLQKMDVVRTSARISRRNTMRNEEVTIRVNMEGSIIDNVERKQLIWYGHVERMNDIRLQKKIYSTIISK